MNVIDHSAKKDCRTYANCDKAARILSCEEKMMRTLCSWEYLPWLASAILADAWLLSRCDSDLMYILSFVLIILICIFYSVMIFCPSFWSDAAEKVFRNHENKYDLLTKTRIFGDSGSAVILEHCDKELTREILDGQSAADRAENAGNIFLVKRVFRKCGDKNGSYYLYRYDRMSGVSHAPFFLKNGCLSDSDPADMTLLKYAVRLSLGLEKPSKEELLLQKLMDPGSNIAGERKNIVKKQVCTEYCR